MQAVVNTLGHSLGRKVKHSFRNRLVATHLGTDVESTSRDVLQGLGKIQSGAEGHIILTHGYNVDPVTLKLTNNGKVIKSKV